MPPTPFYSTCTQSYKVYKDTHIICTYCSSFYFSTQQLNICDQTGFIHFFFLLKGMAIHNVVRNRNFTHSESKVWATAAADMLASGDKLPSDHTSKTDVRGQCDNSSTGNCLPAEATEVQDLFNPCAR